MMAYIKSKTIMFLAFLSAVAMPGVSDPLWAILTDAGFDPQLVAWLKLIAFVLGIAGAVYGRKVAKGPLGESG